MNKKGIEIAINFIVMLILAIVIFTFGIIFATRLMGGGNKVIEHLPKMEEAILDNCVKNGKPICLPKNRKEIFSGKGDVFGLAIQNTFGQTKEFKVYLDFSTAIDSQNDPIDPLPFTVDEVSFIEYGPYSIKNNEHEKIPIPINIPNGVDEGEYVFNVNVCFDDGDDTNIPSTKCLDTTYFPDLYETTHKIYVEVK